MDIDTVKRVYETMAHPEKREAAIEFKVDKVLETYSSTYARIPGSLAEKLDNCKDPHTIWLEISRFIRALEKTKKVVAETEAECVGISPEQANAKLSSFIDHLYYYIACEPKSNFFIGDTKNIILSYEGSLLSVAGQALAQALVTGCAIVLLAYEEFSSTAKLLEAIWTKAELPAGRFKVCPNFPQTLLSIQPSLKIFVGGQLVDGQNYHNLQPYFLNGYTTPLLVLDGADIESVVSVVLDTAHLFRHVEPWALSVIVTEESQLPKFKALLLERISDPYSLHTHVKPSPADQDKQREHIRKYHLENSSAEIHHLAHYRYIVFGSQPSRSNRLWHHDLNGHPLYVLPVRSATEAVTKANHYGSGYAAAVFTEDGSLSQFVAEKLQASTVWINTIGLLHPAAPLPFQVVNTNSLGHCQLSSYQSSGNVFNLLLFGTVAQLNAEELTGSNGAPETFSQQVQDKVKAAVAAQPAWQALGGLGRSKLFFKLFDSCEPRKEITTLLFVNLRRGSAYLKRTTICAETTYANQENGIVITSHLQPYGVVGIYVDNSKCFSQNRENLEMVLEEGGNVLKGKIFPKSEDCVSEAIQGAIAYGNTCVVILADDEDYQLIDTLYGAASSLPKGVVNIIKSKDPSHWVSLVQHQEVKCLWHTGIALRQEHQMLKHFEAKYSKRVWIGVNHYLRKYREDQRLSLSAFEPHATIRKHVWRKSQSN